MDNPYGTPDHLNKVFTLPSAGSVLLYGPEMDLIRTKEFQRLAGIRQLGTSYLVYRGATHTRFEHSLGTLHQVERMIQAILRTGQGEIPKEAHKLARLLALLHDITHVPFGHTIEDELHLLIRHDENRGRLGRLVRRSAVGGILRNTLGTDWYREFIKLMVAKGDLEDTDLKFPFVFDLVGNTVCADLLDYVPRDLRACGMPVGIGGRFLDSLTITSDALEPYDINRVALELERHNMPRPDVDTEVIKLLSYRYELAERVYFHHGKNAASVMIGRALQDSGLVEPEDAPSEEDEAFDRLSDEMLLRALASPEVAKGLGLSLHKRTEAERKMAVALATGVLERRLYEIAYLGVLDDLEGAAQGFYDKYKSASARRELEDFFARRGRLDLGQVLVHLPTPDMLLKPALVRVVTHGKLIETLEDWDNRHSRRTAAINRAHQRLWRLTVYVDRAASSWQKALVRAAAEQAFGAASRYVTVGGLPPYPREVYAQNAPKRSWGPEDEGAIMAARSEAVYPDDMVKEMAKTIRAARRKQARQGAAKAPKVGKKKASRG